MIANGRDDIAKAREAYREAIRRYGDEPSDANRAGWRRAQKRLADLVSRHPRQD